MHPNEDIDLAAYGDDDAVVVCDPTTQGAWIRSDTVVDADIEREQLPSV